MCEIGGLTFSLAEAVNILIAAVIGAAITLFFAWLASRELWTIFRALASAAEHPGRVKFDRDPSGRIKTAQLIAIGGQTGLKFGASGTLEGVQAQDAAATGEAIVNPPRV